MAYEFKLGPPLLKTGDAGHLPDTWRADLLSKHLDGPSRVAVAQTCSAALHWVLEEHPDATLQLIVPAYGAESNEQLVRRLQEVAKQLQLRGNQRTVLSFQQEWGSDGDHYDWWPAFFDALAGPVSPNLTLSLRQERIPAALLSAAGQAFAGLTSLTLEPVSDVQGSYIELPAVSALPSLRRLAIGKAIFSAQAALWHSVEPYLQRLEQLAICDQPHSAALARGGRMWMPMFSATKPSESLTTLSVPCGLDPSFARLLQKATRRLDQLTVTHIKDTTEGADTVADVCSWRTLCLTDVTMHLPQCAWAWLPVPSEGKLVIDMAPVGTLLVDGEPTTVDIPLIATEAVTTKLQCIELQNCAHVRFDASDIPPANQPTHLAAALPTIAPLQSPDTFLILRNFTMTEPLAGLIGPAREGWEQIAFESLTWHPSTPLTTKLPTLGFLDLACPLTDDLATAIHMSVTHIHKLYVPCTQFEISSPEETDWPWDEVTVNEPVAVETFLRQVELVGEWFVWRVEKLVCAVGREEADRGGAHVQWAKQLSSANLTYVGELEVKPPADELLDCEQPESLRAGLVVARACPVRPMCLILAEWSATQEVVAECRALLDIDKGWGSKGSGEMAKMCLFLTSAELEPDYPQLWPIARLPLFIPRFFTTWAIDAAGLTENELETLITLAPPDRTASQPLTIEVYGKDAAWEQSINARLRDMETYPHVTIRVGEYGDEED